VKEKSVSSLSWCHGGGSHGKNEHYICLFVADACDEAFSHQPTLNLRKFKQNISCDLSLLYVFKFFSTACLLRQPLEV
jgi:hypothetical protein